MHSFFGEELLKLTWASLPYIADIAVISAITAHCTIDQWEQITKVYADIVNWHCRKRFRDINLWFLRQGRGDRLKSQTGGERTSTINGAFESKNFHVRLLGKKVMRKGQQTIYFSIGHARVRHAFFSIFEFVFRFERMWGKGWVVINSHVLRESHSVVADTCLVQNIFEVEWHKLIAET